MVEMVSAKHASKGLKVVKKDWQPVIAGKMFDSALIGECPAPNKEALVGRHVVVNLANITGDVRQQGVGLRFTISHVTPEAAVAEVSGYEAATTHLKRLVRKGVDRIDDTFPGVTSDGTEIIIKPFIVTRWSASNATLTSIRKAVREQLIQEIAGRDFETLVSEIIGNKLQITLKKSLAKIYPLMAFEIKALQVVKRGAQPAKQEPEAPEEQAIEAVAAPESK
jgi:ribosomal protein S3AE